MKFKEFKKIHNDLYYSLLASISLVIIVFIVATIIALSHMKINKLEGRWTCSSGDYIEFFEDGSFESSELSSLKHSSGAYPWENNDIDEIYTGTYDYDNNTVTFFYSCTRHDWIDNEKKTVQYIIDKGALKLTNGYDTDIFEKGN